jgi:hypothetical protein
MSPKYGKHDTKQERVAKPQENEHMSIELMKQWLEAFEKHGHAWLHHEKQYADAIASMRQAIEQAENYQHKNPLGGPAKVFDAMADAIRAGDDYHATLRSYGFLERADKKTIDCSGAAGPSITPLNWHSYADKQRALDKKAENARELGLDYEPVQAEKQEPVAWMKEAAGMRHFTSSQEIAERDGMDTPLYIAPPSQEFVCSTGLCHYKAQREFVGLTDEEIALVCGECAASAYRHDDISYARAIEAKLKEKNT